MAVAVGQPPGGRTLGRRRRIVLGTVATLFGGLVALTLYLASQPSLAYTISGRPEPSVPSAETARFLEAYARGDEVAADAFASPLYRAEWARRDLDVSERLAIRRAGKAEAEPLNTLEFRYVWGARMEQGFVRYLYSVRPVGPEGPKGGPYSVWRADADPDGRVVWLELVWLFGPETRKIERVEDAGLLAKVHVPDAAASQGFRPIVGVVSEDTGEGHYLLSTTEGRSAGTPILNGLSMAYALPGAARAPRLLAYTVDGSGMLRPGAWTFGAGDQTVRPYGSARAPTPKLEAAEGDKSLLEGYLQTLR